MTSATLSRRNPQLATITPGSQSRVPRTMPVTYADSVPFSSASMAGGMSNAHFSLTSTSPVSRRCYGTAPSVYPSGQYPHSDDFFLSASSAMTYASMTASDGAFVVPVMSSLGGFDADPTSEFLTEDAFSGDNSPDLNLVQSSQYPGQDQPEDLIIPGYMSMDTSPLYHQGMVNNYSSQSFSVQRLPTPPPEDYVRDCLSAQEKLCPDAQDSALYGSNTVSKALPDSLKGRNVFRPRPIRSASERNGVIDQSVSCILPTETRSPKEEQSDREKARSGPLYEARPDKSGHYHCPMFEKLKCNHQPTKQKCIYNKYVDSHLRPYRCRFTDRPECEDLRFSSNACLLRHEREAHGEHNHGVNPYLCKFPDCDRAREGNGFPRRWNQRDHMKRVHQYEEPEPLPKKSSATQSQNKRKKPTSVPMRRSNSSTLSKVHAMANAAIQTQNYGQAITRAQYVAPGAYTIQTQDYDAMMPQTVSMDDVQFSPTTAISRTCRVSPPYSGIYPS
ncbi:hypothetical protein Z517_09785 [Fonsecaea pedrosoi CBS 271.37]|uniref:C2H2-type domain-containing protein n=1 Tax=Fonsecaea pedrosoi CBS 271.37 TaxID=1442368 RepID=A0A0D2GY83_9EURO|nr:uncharacterized protein Z517_09785 [Fonsecaea pedrosoi CBS 271.37]KIW77339.1 hypothetical protein Z517_09785 [Fonsecaea pedrosoi CBS 271.37]